tara:strand:+ start:116 stop:514 length:399 start_codon:yes stop_codon:yes gene_type:complete
MKLKTLIAMTVALMIGAGGSTPVQAQGNRDRGFRSEANEKKNSDKRAHTRRDQGSRGSQARGGLRGPRGLMASRGHQGSDGPKDQHARGGQKGQPRGNKVRRDGQGRPGSNAQRLAVANAVVIRIVVAERVA